MKPGTDRVVFGHMHEDQSVELSLVGRLPLKTALVIASGGDLAFALAGKKVGVTAVDSNPAQIDLARSKMLCPPDLIGLCFCGRVDGFLRIGGRFLSWLVDWPRSRPGPIRVFLTDLLEALVHPVVSCLHGSAAARRVDRTAIRLMRRRLEDALRDPLASRNPWLQVLLGNRFGCVPPDVWSERGIAKWKSEVHRIVLISAELGKVLDDTEEGSVGLISVSNLPDVMEAEAWTRLVERAGNVLIPGGFLVVRSMLRDQLVSSLGAAFVREADPAGDASPLCPVIWIGRKL